MAFSVTEMELSHPIAPLLTGEHSHGLALARWHHQPVGWVWAASAGGQVGAETWASAIREQVAWDLVVATLTPQQPSPATAVLPPISVVVCSRNRADSLAVCLRSLVELDYPAFEIIVVDNASDTDATQSAARVAGVRCVREDRPGLDWARNRGIAAATHGIIAFTDDDVRVDRLWLRGVARGFSDPSVMAVTGLVAPMELETRAQLLFEHVYGGMGKGMTGRLYYRGNMRPARMIEIHRLGVGANMAFRRDVFTRIDPFDTALDVGTPSSGAGDLDMFHRVVASGMALWYEPRALVWHRHRVDLPALETQLFNDGRSFTVYLLKLWRTRSVPRLAVARYAVWIWARWLVGRVVLGLFRRHRLPLRLLWAALRGAATGPWAYLATYRRDRILRTAQTHD